MIQLTERIKQLVRAKLKEDSRTGTGASVTTGANVGVSTKYAYKKPTKENDNIYRELGFKPVNKKQLRKKSRRQKHKSHRRQTKKMVGGDFTDADSTELGTIGFNNNDIALLEQHIPIMNIIRTSLGQINPQTGNPFTPQELIQDLQNTLNDEPNDELNISGISNISGDSDNASDVDLNDGSMNTTIESMNASINNDNDNLSFGEGSSLNLPDLDGDNGSNNTTIDDSFGGKKKRRKTMKKQKRRTKKRTMKKRKGRKQRGGTCYGNGVGANNYDPNFSIHNTNLLKLFPYKPTN